MANGMKAAGHVVGFGAFVVEQVDRTLDAFEGQCRATSASSAAVRTQARYTIDDGSGGSGRQRLGLASSAAAAAEVPVEHEGHWRTRWNRR